MSRADLELVNPYLPNLAASWLFQRAMGVPVGAAPAPDVINSLLAANFRCVSSFKPCLVLRVFGIDFGPL